LETVDFRKLPGETEDAARFLKEHVEGRVEHSRHELQVEGLKHRELKLLLHKYLRHKGLDGYRVLSNSGVLEIAPAHETEHITGGSRHEGSVPPASVTMPYYFPGGASSMPRPRKARRHKS
jgi:hypothetical protein